MSGLQLLLQGTVKEHNVATRRVLVVYEDGDEEHMSINSLKHFLVPDAPESGRRKASVAAARLPALTPAATASQELPAESPGSVQEGVPHLGEAEQPQEAASSRDAEAAATMASWAPGGGARAAPPSSVPMGSAGSGLPNGIPALGSEDSKPQTPSANAVGLPADQQQLVPLLVPQLPPPASALDSTTSNGQLPEQAQAPRNGAASAGAEGEAGPFGSQLHIQSATPAPGVGCFEPETFL